MSIPNTKPVLGFFLETPKYLLLFFNFLIAACGIALITIGSIILVNESKGIDRFTEFSLGRFAISVGVIIFPIAFYGCRGAFKESMLTNYVVVLVILLILQIVLGALSFDAIKNDNGELDRIVKTAAKKVFDDYWHNLFDLDKKKIVDSIQQAFECCGVDGSSDWGPIACPSSCYKDRTATIAANLYKEGCAKAFQDIITANIKVNGGIALGFAAIELVGVIFAFMVRS